MLTWKNCYGNLQPMTNEVPKPEGSKLPNIVETTILVGESEFKIPTVDGKPYRIEEPVQLGKRYVCAQEIVTESVSDVIDPSAGKPMITKTYTLISGEYKDKNGKTINLGCGTQALCTKVGVPVNKFFCCDLPMIIEHQKAVPTSD
jgi:hypothetical protein